MATVLLTNALIFDGEQKELKEEGAVYVEDDLIKEVIRSIFEKFRTHMPLIMKAGELKRMEIT